MIGERAIAPKRVMALFGSINVGVAIILTFIFLEKIIKKESKNEGNPLE